MQCEVTWCNIFESLRTKYITQIHSVLWVHYFSNVYTQDTWVFVFNGRWYAIHYGTADRLRTSYPSVIDKVSVHPMIHEDSLLLQQYISLHPFNYLPSFIKWLGVALLSLAKALPDRLSCTRSCIEFLFAMSDNPVTLWTKLSSYWIPTGTGGGTNQYWWYYQRVSAGMFS